MKKILVIDDDKIFQEAYQIQLQKAGYAILQAYSGTEGFEMAKMQKPDLILLDILMPNEDGLSTLTKLKSTVETHDIPVIMLTNVETETADALKTGAVWYYVKSNTSLEELTKRIKEIIPG